MPYAGRAPIWISPPRHPAAAAPSLLLDSLSAAPLGAYSCNDRLATSYTGALVRVRRSSDNTEADIGYTAGNVLDRTALLAHVGAGNGFVTKLYDQSGNGRDLAQTTAARQPQIVASGTISVSGGNVVFDNLAANSADGLTRSDALSLSGDHDVSIFWLGKLSSTSGSHAMARVGNSNGYTLAHVSPNITTTWGSNPGNNVWTDGAGTAMQYLLAAYTASADGDAVEQNGSAMTHTTYATAALSMANTEFRLGYAFCPSRTSAAIVWGSILGSGDKTALNAWAETRRTA
jgi:hypothetical protein